MSQSSSAEDRLRELLRAEASGVVVAGEGLSKVQQRVARRRRRRAILLPGAALATAGALAAFFVLNGGSGSQRLVQTPATQGPTSNPSTTTSPAPPPAVTFTDPAIWPFTSQPQADAWKSDHGARAWAVDPLQVATHFVEDYLGLTGVVASGTGSHIPLSVGSRSVGTVDLVQVGTDGPWTVTTVGGTDLTITSPAADDAITSPTAVTGRITGVDENVRLRLLTSSGREISSAGASAGTAVPWQGSLPWSDTTWSTAGLVGTTVSAKDGSLTRLVAVPVRRATGSTVSGASFVALVDGHVSLYDASSGSRLSQLTYPPSPTVDTGAAWAGSTLAWVRSTPTGCADTLYRMDNGRISTVVPAGSVHLGTPQLSPSSGWLAWQQSDCSGTSREVVVSGGGAPARHLALAPGQTAEVLDVGEDGSVLLLGPDSSSSGSPSVLRFVPGGALDLSSSHVVVGASGCALRAAALDRGTVVAAEACGSQSRIVRAASSGSRTRTDAFLSDPGLLSAVTIRDTTVLVQTMSAGRAGPIGTYSNGAVTAVAQRDGCAISPGSGCLRQPDW